MITWMQRHKKYLIITIWVSTIAFVGAGFVGWGQYSYGDKAGAVAKVGTIEITMGELQKAYSRLYSQYSQMFQGNFDEEKAKSFGLKKQALQQLNDQALILNLAAGYDLQISDSELFDELKTQEYFFKNGVFDKETYKDVLSKNNLKMQEYEADVKKQLLIQKTLKLLPLQTSENELSIVKIVANIADKVNYKILSDEAIKIDTTDASLKPYWEKVQQNFMSEVTYDVKYIKQNKVSQKYDEAKINEFYEQNKANLKDKDGKILALEDAKEAVIAGLNDKTTKDLALKTYIAYKKGKLEEGMSVQTSTVSDSNNPYDTETLEKIKKLSLTSPFLKPVLINGDYFIFELAKINPSKIKSYEEAKEAVLSHYTAEQKKSQLLNSAKAAMDSFSGTVTDFVTSSDAAKLSDMEATEANEFLTHLFNQQNKKGYIALKSGKIVLFNILEQKMLNNENISQSDTIARLKSAMFNDGLINSLKNSYRTEIFIQGF
ncbi:MAG: SurA N-terminal domain-containing protein [Campylobacterales bacterium]|nr:SurA N-terminal domain-containing protein [Campylobacterales bacterium]